MRNLGCTVRRFNEIITRRDKKKMGVTPYIICNRIRLNITEARDINGYHQIELTKKQARMLVRQLSMLLHSMEYTKFTW